MRLQSLPLPILPSYKMMPYRRRTHLMTRTSRCLSSLTKSVLASVPKVTPKVPCSPQNLSLRYTPLLPPLILSYDIREEPSLRALLDAMLFLTLVRCWMVDGSGVKPGLVCIRYLRTFCSTTVYICILLIDICYMSFIAPKGEELKRIGRTSIQSESKLINSLQRMGESQAKTQLT